MPGFRVQPNTVSGQYEDAIVKLSQGAMTLLNSGNVCKVLMSPASSLNSSMGSR